MLTDRRSSVSVLRQDAASGDWVILAPVRERRPQQVAGKPATREDCPLCPGHESRTPPELLRIPADCRAPWSVRVVPNKFALLSPAQSAEQACNTPLLREHRGYGHHEVIVEGPGHEPRMAELSLGEVAAVLDAYSARYAELRSDPRVAYVLVFKNCGVSAGASLVHPHSQLMATQVAPLELQHRIARARKHFEHTGRCLQLDAIEAELRARERVVSETDRFVAYCPFASVAPYEVRIAPKAQQAAFGATSSAERLELAGLLRSTLLALDRALELPAFNYMLHTAPLAHETSPYYLWHLQIRPRTATLAGFELGSGIATKTVFPEEAAARLRQKLGA
ncbi:MAG: galactose-1-phosphate uridylyltransferase [Proteobacteria bacterium]|nr:galactose-1-phosphate uridylyltransferase [Pseudomonadota bacterium]